MRLLDARLGGDRRSLTSSFISKLLAGGLCTGVFACSLFSTGHIIFLSGKILVFVKIKAVLAF